ncbi:MAG: NERD domain-containing protein, partial [Nocardioides sp.]|nr:NERD domain-containing protein [Nocardioides sp.]
NPAERRRRQLAEDEVAMLRAALDDERRRAELAQAERDWLREQATSVTVRSQPEAPAWHETEAGGFVLDLGAPETFGEERLRQALGQLESAVVLLDVTVGSLSIDAVVVHPGGVAVVEQYDLPATAAVVSVPASGGAQVGDHALDEDPRGEVMAAVRALQKRAALDLAYLPVVAFQGPADASAEDVLACLTSELDLAVDDALLDRPDQQPVAAEQVVALLTRLGVPELLRVPDGF